MIYFLYVHTELIANISCLLNEKKKPTTVTIQPGQKIVDFKV